MRMTHKATVSRKRDPCVTRRKMVDVLTPRLSNLGLKERAGLEVDRGSVEGWLPPASAVADGPSSEGAGGCSLSAGWWAGTTVS